MSLSLHEIAPIIGRGTGLRYIPPGTYVFAIHRGSSLADPPNVCSLLIVNHNNPADTSFPYGRRGDLPRGITRPYASFSYGGHLYVCDDKHPEKIWRINPHDSVSQTPPYGDQGNLPGSSFSADGATVHDGKILVGDLNPGGRRDKLWRLNPDDWDRTAPPYGSRGNMPGGMNSVDSLVSHNGSLYAFDGSDHELWKINPNSPTSTSGTYGNKGETHEDMWTPGASVSIDNKLLVLDRYGTVWNVNPSSPASITGGYGKISEDRIHGQRQDIGSAAVHSIT